MKGMKKVWKLLIGAVLGIGALVLITTVVRNLAFRSSPLSNHMTVEEVESLGITVGYIETSEEWTDDVYDSFCKEQKSGAKECGNIFVGIPTGNIYFNRGTILEEVTVEQVIEGNCKYDTIWIRNGLNCTLRYEDGGVFLKGMDRSFMQKDCKYLLFCDSSPTNKYSDKKVYTETEFMWHGCYNITRNSDYVMEEGENQYNPRIEFYTTSQRTLDVFNQAKSKLMKKYLGENE